MPEASIHESGCKHANIYVTSDRHTTIPISLSISLPFFLCDLVLLVLYYRLPICKSLAPLGRFYATGGATIHLTIHIYRYLREENKNIWKDIDVVKKENKPNEGRRIPLPVAVRSL